MTDPRSILVTGASGNVGAPLVSQLRAAGLPVVAAAARPRDDVRRLDFEDPATCRS
jgi:uncharacterized protein YbjT (DUF2867 family)